MLGGGREEGTENELLRAQLLRHEADILAFGGWIRKRWRDLVKRFPRRGPPEPSRPGGNTKAAGLF